MGAECRQCTIRSPSCVCLFLFSTSTWFEQTTGFYSILYWQRFCDVDHKRCTVPQAFDDTVADAEAFRSVRSLNLARALFAARTGWVKHLVLGRSVDVSSSGEHTPQHGQRRRSGAPAPGAVVPQARGVRGARQRRRAAAAVGAPEPPDPRRAAQGDRPHPTHPGEPVQQLDARGEHREPAGRRVRLQQPPRLPAAALLGKLTSEPTRNSDAGRTPGGRLRDASVANAPRRLPAQGETSGFFRGGFKTLCRSDDLAFLFASLLRGMSTILLAMRTGTVTGGCAV